MCSLPSRANVSTVHSVVSMARSSADSGGLRVGVRGIGRATWRRRRRCRRRPADGCVRRRRGSKQRAGVRRTGAARRDLPDDAAADRLVEQLAERAAGGVEELERLVDVVGQQEAGDRVDLRVGIDLVDAWPRAASRRRPAASTRRNIQRAGRGQARRQRAACRARRARRCATGDGDAGRAAGRGRAPKASTRRAPRERERPAASGSGGSPASAAGVTVGVASALAHAVRGRRRSASRAAARAGRRGWR